MRRNGLFFRSKIRVHSKHLNGTEALFTEKKALPNNEKPLKNKGIPAFCAVDFRFRNIEMDRTSHAKAPERALLQ